MLTLKSHWPRQRHNKIWVQYWVSSCIQFTKLLFNMTLYYNIYLISIHTVPRVSRRVWHSEILVWFEWVITLSQGTFTLLHTDSIWTTLYRSHSVVHVISNSHLKQTNTLINWWTVCNINIFYQAVWNRNLLARITRTSKQLSFVLFQGLLVSSSTVNGWTLWTV